MYTETVLTTISTIDPGGFPGSVELRPDGYGPWINPDLPLQVRVIDPDISALLLAMKWVYQETEPDALLLPQALHCCYADIRMSDWMPLPYKEYGRNDAQPRYQPTVQVEGAVDRPYRLHRLWTPCYTIDRYEAALQCFDFKKFLLEAVAPAMKQAACRLWSLKERWPNDRRVGPPPGLQDGQYLRYADAGISAHCHHTGPIMHVAFLVSMMTAIWPGEVE